MGCKKMVIYFEKGMLLNVTLLKNVVLVRRKGPCNMNYKIGKEDNESGLKEVVVSHKCGQAILQGAHVCSKH